MITYTWCTVICNKDQNNSVGIVVTCCENLSAFKILAGRKTLFCWPSHQLLAIRYNSSVINSKLFILFSPSLFQYCWFQILIISPFCLQDCSHSECKLYFTLKCKSVNIRDRRVGSLNIFENIGQIVCFYLQSGHHWINWHLCLVGFSLGNSWRLTVNI